VRDRALIANIAGFLPRFIGRPGFPESLRRICPTKRCRTRRSSNRPWSARLEGPAAMTPAPSCARTDVPWLRWDWNACDRAGQPYAGSSGADIKLRRGAPGVGEIEPHRKRSRRSPADQSGASGGMTPLESLLNSAPLLAGFGYAIAIPPSNLLMPGHVSGMPAGPVPTQRQAISNRRPLSHGPRRLLQSGRHGLMAGTLDAPAPMPCTQGDSWA